MKRADILTAEKLGITRQKAQQLIKEGAVVINGKTVKKPSEQLDDSAELSVLENDALKYVGRGGLKLEAAIKAFGLDAKDRVCVDIGASTGGFTDCLLQNGAKKVYAVDVGTAQLAEKLQNDSRVCCFENTNITDFVCPEKADIAVCDVSFVSLDKILSNISALKPEKAVVLVKPQFEAGRENISKNGIVKDPAVHKNVLRKVISAAAENGLFCGGIIPSPIKGGDGNIEFLMLLGRENGYADTRYMTENAVKEAHSKTVSSRWKAGLERTDEEYRYNS